MLLLFSLPHVILTFQLQFVAVGRDYINSARFNYFRFKCFLPSCGYLKHILTFQHVSINISSYRILGVSSDKIHYRWKYESYISNIDVNELL